MNVFFSAVLDTNGKMTTFSFYPYYRNQSVRWFFMIKNSFRNHHFYLFSWTFCYNSCKKNHLENVFSSSSQVWGKLQNIHFANSTENGWKKKFTICKKCLFFNFLKFAKNPFFSLPKLKKHKSLFFQLFEVCNNKKKVFFLEKILAFFAF